MVTKRGFRQEIYPHATVVSWEYHPRISVPLGIPRNYVRRGDNQAAPATCHGKALANGYNLARPGSKRRRTRPPRRQEPAIPNDVLTG